MITDTDTNVNIDSQTDGYHIANYGTDNAKMLGWSLRDGLLDISSLFLSLTLPP